MRFIRCDRWGSPLCDIEAISAKRKRDLSGTDTLDITTLADIEKDDRIIFKDSMGRWCEQIVSSPESKRAGGVPINSIYGKNSMCELAKCFITDKRCDGYSATMALGKALEGTPWQVGKVDVAGTNTISFYHTDALSAVEEIANLWGAEVESSIESDGSRVTARRVSLLSRRGANNGKRFTNTRDLMSVRRTVSSENVITRLYAYGKGIQSTDEDGNATGGYSRKIDIASVNGGKEYIEDASLIDEWGLVDSKGKARHSEGMVDFPDCDDPAELLSLANARFEEMKVPKISYESDVKTFGRGGLDRDGTDIGDTVQIVDTTFTTALRVEGRVTAIDESLIGGSADTNLTLGNIYESLSGRQAALDAVIQNLASSAPAWSAAAAANDSYINGVIDGLNSVMNATGGYTYMEKGVGITIYDRPKDENPTKAIQLGGGFFRIASSKKSNGEWDWRTFGTGAGFTADEIVAGVLRGQNIMINLNDGTVEFKRGVISDVAGSMSIDLNEGAISMRDGYYYMDIDPKFGIELLYKDTTRSMPIFSTKQRAVKNGNVSTVFASGITTSGLLLDDAFSADSESLPIAMIKGSTLHHQDTGSKSGAISFRVYKEPTGQDSLNTAAYMGLSELGWEVGIGSMKNASSTRIMVTKDSVYVTGNLVVNGKLIS